MHAASLRARFLVALGLASPFALACEPPMEANHPPPPEGSASVPPVETIAPPGDATTTTVTTATATATTTVTTATATATATAPIESKVLPLPGELACPPPPPPPPPGKFVPMGGCNVQPSCRPPLAAMPAQHYAAPFERCQPSGNSGAFGLSFSAKDTKAIRADKGSDVCCYRTMQLHPAGRPLRVDGAIALAPLGEGEGWTTRGGRPLLGADRRAAVSRHFRAIAAVEHASVASFARTSLQLLALGAPAALLADVHEAARDEIAHASGALALAADEAPLAPGPYPAAVAPIEATFAALVRDTVIDGCLGETMGALEATAAAERCADETIRAFLLRVADDEARHAELAYRILAWALANGGMPRATL